MDEIESPKPADTFQASLAYVRGLLTPPPPRERVWPALAAATAFAVCAMAFATAAILSPPVKLTIPQAAATHDR